MVISLDLSLEVNLSQHHTSQGGGAWLRGPDATPFSDQSSPRTSHAPPQTSDRRCTWSTRRRRRASAVPLRALLPHTAASRGVAPCPPHLERQPRGADVREQRRAVGRDDDARARPRRHEARRDAERRARARCRAARSRQTAARCGPGSGAPSAGSPREQREQSGSMYGVARRRGRRRRPASRRAWRPFDAPRACVPRRAQRGEGAWCL